MLVCFGILAYSWQNNLAKYYLLNSYENIGLQEYTKRDCHSRPVSYTHLYMVHRPFRLAEIMGLMMQYKLEPKRMRLVYPYVDREPNMVLIEGLLGGNSRITVEKPLIVYEKPGVYTQEIREIYGDGR